MIQMIEYKRSAISYNTLTVFNIPVIDYYLDGNTHEEAHTLMILHAVDVAYLNPVWHVCIISQKSETLLEFHAFISCDQSSKFNGNSEATYWKAFLYVSEDVLAAFPDLRVRNDLADATLTSLEKYVVRLFCESGDLNSLTDGRWNMYTR